MNASPSLTTTTHSDRILKTQLISDVIDIVHIVSFRLTPQVMPPEFPCDVAYKAMRRSKPGEDGPQYVEHKGFFDVLYDEAQDLCAANEAFTHSTAKRAPRR